MSATKAQELAARLLGELDAHDKAKVEAWAEALLAAKEALEKVKDEEPDHKFTSRHGDNYCDYWEDGTCGAHKNRHKLGIRRALALLHALLDKGAQK